MRKLDPVKHAEKRQEILAAAGRCFLRDGFRGASTSDICAEAKISPGHLYHYFESKEAIIGAMVEARLEEATARFGKMTEGADPVDTLLLEVKAMPAARGRVGQPFALEILAEAGRNPAMAKVLQAHTRGMRALLADLLRNGQARGQIDPGLDPELAASLLISVIDGSKTLAVRDPKLDSKKCADLLRILITRFLAPTAARR